MTSIGLLGPGIFLLFFSAVTNKVLALMWVHLLLYLWQTHCRVWLSWSRQWSFHTSGLILALVLWRVDRFTRHYNNLFLRSPARGRKEGHKAVHSGPSVSFIDLFDVSDCRFVSISMALSACNSSGHLSNHADVAPAHAGITFAISNTLVSQQLLPVIYIHFQFSDYPNKQDLYVLTIGHL